MSTPSSVRLLLVRHGQAASNRELRYLGSQDEPLTELGCRQARELAGSIEGLAPTQLYTSPLRRARQTAAAIGEVLTLDTHLEPRLAEQSFGVWEGKTHEEVLRAGGRSRQNLLRWLEDPEYSPPGGESWNGLLARASGLAAELAARHPGERVVLVTHVGPIKALMAVALDLSLSQSRHTFLDPGTVTVLDWGERRVLRAFNVPGGGEWSLARWAASEGEVDHRNSAP